MKGLLVKDGVISPVDVDDYRSIQKLLNEQPFTTCFNIRSPARGNGHAITGYCDDEGLLPHSPNFQQWNVLPQPRVLRPDHQMIAGPIVIQSTNMFNGEPEELLDEDAARFCVEERPFLIGTIRVLKFRK